MDTWVYLNDFVSHLEVVCCIAVHCIASILWLYWLVWITWSALWSHDLPVLVLSWIRPSVAKIPTRRRDLDGSGACMPVYIQCMCTCTSVFRLFSKHDQKNKVLYTTMTVSVKQRFCKQCGMFMLCTYSTISFNTPVNIRTPVYTE